MKKKTLRTQFVFLKRIMNVDVEYNLLYNIDCTIGISR